MSDPEIRFSGPSKTRRFKARSQVGPFRLIACLQGLAFDLLGNVMVFFLNCVFYRKK